MFINNDESNHPATLDYHSLLTMATRASSSLSAITLLQQRQEIPRVKKLSNSHCIHKYTSTNTTEIEYPDGTHIYEFPNRQIEKHLPDVQQEHIFI
ncbi:unnamed protein product [Rotaria sordida]|uniref:Uncharacterized protein n=1 Tax=Rotaria sordida TaxID=392033 RepID=A0A815HDN2_9BILA|nr:unnamed protein product [Rotaria sordida]CAF1349464.1 unnamed protein product [Rotaria sordida]